MRLGANIADQLVLEIGQKSENGARSVKYSRSLNKSSIIIKEASIYQALITYIRLTKQKYQAGVV